jgi:hypothetical protein
MGGGIESVVCKLLRLTLVTGVGSTWRSLCAMQYLGVWMIMDATTGVPGRAMVDHES